MVYNQSATRVCDALRSRLRVTGRDAFARAAGHSLKKRTPPSSPGGVASLKRINAPKNICKSSPDAHHALSLWSSTRWPLLPSLSATPAMLSGQSVVRCLALLVFVQVCAALTPVDPSKSPRILRPNGADVWTVGDVATIRWCVLVPCSRSHGSCTDHLYMAGATMAWPSLLK